MQFIVLVTLNICALVFSTNIDHNQKIVGGQNALPGQFPYIASLRLGNHKCGGTILNKKTIITAAHCNYGTSMIAVVGSTTLNSGGFTYKISNFIEHPKWDIQTKQNDIAVVILKDNIKFNSDVQPLSLASKDIGDNSEVIASGWGYTSYPGSAPNDLKWIQLKTISKETCRSLHSGFLSDSQICTLTKAGEGVCSGDSGGPLVANGELVGITSAAYLCALGLPDFFTRVYSFKSWIEENSAYSIK